MCSLFGWLDYQGIMPHRMLRKLTQALANAAEERGTDAAGISYVRNGDVIIYKRPKPAHKLHFNPPDGTVAVMGHTRMTTQGDKSQNFNNHPFRGVAGDNEFAFAHNGCLYNDKSLRKEKQLPTTNIETDSYIAVQLIESQRKLGFDSLRYMAEAVQGSFTFSLLDEDNSLYFVKGNNPITLLHFKSLGLFVYASTDTIMRAAMKRIGLNKFAYERIDIDEGDILKIDKNGNITRSQFQPAPKYSHFSSDKWWYGDECYYGEHEEMLFLYCNCFGVDTADVELLLEYGYTPSEVEEMLTDHSLLRETLREVKLMIGEDIYDDYCYRGAW